MIVDKDMRVLQAIYHHPKTLQSNYVRKHSELVAKLASLGLITTNSGYSFGKVWLVTASGIAAIHGYYAQEIEDEY